MSDDYALLDKDGDAEPLCERCEAVLEWADCDQCSGEGRLDNAFDLDPFRYDLGDTSLCYQCAGVGGWFYCPNPQCHVVEVSS